MYLKKFNFLRVSQNLYLKKNSNKTNFTHYLPSANHLKTWIKRRIWECRSLVLELDRKAYEVGC